MRKIPLYTHAIIIGLWIISAFALMLLPFDTFFNFIVSELSLENHREQFATILTKQVYLRVGISLLFVSVFHGALFFFLLKYESFRETTKTGMRSVLYYPRWLLNQFSKLNNFEKGFFLLFFVLLIIQRLLLSNQTPVVYDEAWTYLAFTSKNPAVAACFYPSSNNHILFSHLTQLTKIFPSTILANIRLAALISNLLALTTLFFCLRHYFKSLTVWALLLCLSVCFPMNYYGFVARGYSLIVFFFVIGFFSILKIIENPSSEKAWFRLMISSALGFYTIPVYLYPLITLFGFAAVYFIITKNHKALYTSILYGIATSALILLLYLPVFAISGIESVTSNKYVSAIPFKEVLAGLSIHLQKTMQFFTGINHLLVSVCGFLIISVVAFFGSTKKNKPAVIFGIFCLLITPLLILVHRIIPVERTWIYLLIPLTFLGGIVLDKFKQTIPIAALAFTYLLFLSFQFKKQANWYDEICEEDSPQGAYFSAHFHGLKAAIADDTRMLTFLKFNQLLRHEDWDLYTEFDKEIPKNAYIIQYLKDEKKDSIPLDFPPLLEYKGYRLLIHSKP